MPTKTKLPPASSSSEVLTPLWLVLAEGFSSCLSAEYAENIGEGKNVEFRESEQKRIMELLETF